MKLKENISSERYNNMVNNALVCELGYYIGCEKNIDEYIKKRLLSLDFEGSIDEFVLFYMFCKFVVDVFNDSKISSIYDLIDENYMKLVDMFIEKFFID